jgi:GNAT superfamily N-acetyltransferase
VAEMALMPITQRDKEFLLQVQFRSMTETYRRNFPEARYDIIELDRWPIGRVISEVQPNYVYFIDFALLPQAQGLGIGTMVLAAALEEARQLGLPARLRSFSYNWAAQRLYDTSGNRVRSGLAPGGGWSARRHRHAAGVADVGGAQR